MAYSAAAIILPNNRQTTLRGQFPFRDIKRKREARERVNAEISRVMRSIFRMLHKLVRERLGKRADQDSINEMVQQCMIWLWRKSLPKWDSTLNTKISTYLYKCASNFVNQEVRALNRRHASRRRIATMDPDMMIQTLRAPDTALDHKVEEVATDVLEHPDKYLTMAQVKVFNALQDNPGMLMKDLAEMLGYQRASSLSMMKRRIYERITAIDIEDFDADEERG